MDVLLELLSVKLNKIPLVWYVLEIYPFLLVLSKVPLLQFFQSLS